MRFIIEKHINSYHTHIAEALLGIESISILRLNGWEDEIVHSIANNNELSEASKKFIQNPSYGDGGMASAVRIESSHN